MLSGCLQEEEKAETEDNGTGIPPADEHGLMTMPMDVHDCSFIMAVIPVTPSQVAAYLPEGFTTVPATALGIPAPEEFAQGKTAMLGLEVETCAKVRQPDGSYSAGPTGSYWIPVQPPEAQRKPGADFYVVKLDILGWNADGVHMLKDAGLLADTGKTSILEPFPTGNLPATPADSELFGMNWYSASLQFDNGETITYQGGGSLTKYFVASPFQKFTCYGFFPKNGDPKQGIIEGRTDFEASVIHESMGALTVSGSGTASKIVGAGEHNYYALVGYGSYWNQEMYLPAPEPHAEDDEHQDGDDHGNED